MATLLLRAFSAAAIVFSISLLAQAQTVRYAPAPKALLQDVLKRNPIRQGDKPVYSCAWVDLNGDRVEEAILWSPATEGGRLFDSGNRYDGFVVYQKAASGFKYIGGGLYGREAKEIGLLHSRAGKWLDLASYKFHFGDEKNPRDNYWYRCRYGAKGYASEEAPLKSARTPMILINQTKAPRYPVAL